MSKTHEGSDMPIPAASIPMVDAKTLITPHQASTAPGAPLSLDTSWFATWRGNGIIHLNINCPAIHAGSTVLIGLSEYSNTANPAGSRFIGGARYAIYNIAPREGGVVIWAEVSWSNPLNIYIEILIN